MRSIDASHVLAIVETSLIALCHIAFYTEEGPCIYTSLVVQSQRILAAKTKIGHVDG